MFREHEFQIKLVSYPDWDRKAQIEKNQSLIQCLEKRKQKEKNMAEEEIQHLQEDFQLLEEIIKNYR